MTKFAAGVDIQHFLTVYREELPAESVFPKLHYLEDHIVPFVRQWKVGPGILGEHGGESIHRLCYRSTAACPLLRLDFYTPSNIILLQPAQRFGHHLHLHHRLRRNKDNITCHDSVFQYVILYMLWTKSDDFLSTLNFEQALQFYFFLHNSFSLPPSPPPSLSLHRSI